MTSHYCREHQTKFYRNEKTDANGQLKIWYSHKMLDGNGFCAEKNTDQAQLSSQRLREHESSPSQYMLMCNAMNNAVALASSGKISVDQVGSYYQRILAELTKTTA